MDFAYAKNFRAGFIFTADGARMNSINACLIVVVRINAKQNGGLILFSIPLKFQNGTRSKDFENLFSKRSSNEFRKYMFIYRCNNNNNNNHKR